jgi:hypothetical protein
VAGVRGQASGAGRRCRGMQQRRAPRFASCHPPKPKLLCPAAAPRGTTPPAHFRRSCPRWRAQTPAACSPPRPPSSARRCAGRRCPGGPSRRSSGARHRAGREGAGELGWAWCGVTCARVHVGCLEAGVLAHKLPCAHAGQAGAPLEHKHRHAHTHTHTYTNTHTHTHTHTHIHKHTHTQTNCAGSAPRRR